MSQLSEMVKTMAGKILNLERELSEQTRRANVAEAWQRRLTTLLARQPVRCVHPDGCSDMGGPCPTCEPYGTLAVSRQDRS